jgi:glycosyltransferase involved in cell wall biosynthesis
VPLLWIVNHYAQEPGGPGGTRHFSLATHLKVYGWDSLILAGSCEHNTGRQRLRPSLCQSLQSFDDIDFLFLKVPFEPSSVGLLRIFSMIAFSLNILRPSISGTSPSPDLVIGSTVHPFAAFAACWLARRHGVPFVFEVRDLWPTTLVAMGAIRSGGFLDHLFGWIERWLAKQSDLIIVLMPGGIDYYHSLGIPRERLLWLPNGAELPCSQLPPIRAKPIPFQLLYCGAHGLANALETVLDAMSLLLHSGVGPSQLILRLIGDGPCKAALQQRAKELELSNVFFEPPVSKKVLASVITQADGFVVAMQPLPDLYRYGISFNKLFDYFQAGRPIVSASCAAHDPVLAAQAGLVVPAGDPSALADAIDKLRQLPHEERERFGLNGLTYLKEKHSYALLAQRLASRLNNLVSP